MSSRRLLCSAFFVLLLIRPGNTPAQDASSCPEPQPAEDRKFHPGQVWAYKTREDEAGSKITILKIDSLPRIGEVIHIRIDGLRLKNCASGPVVSNVVQHAPFTRDAIERSVTRLLKNDAPVPDFEEGYSQWLRHCAGVYSITVAESVDIDERTLQQEFRACD
ncbi:MAG TPA: hypothetical protein VL240_06815 [Candidatus Binatia bacterium]|nr:hypothetical protein [Candidatus Binatia bacterium]